MGLGGAINTNGQIVRRSSAEQMLEERKSREWNTMERAGRDRKGEIERDCSSDGKSGS